mgnify:FL=1
MGWLSKAWKGLKKGVKKIGKGIKSAFKKFGKFMGKFGVVGQVAMFFIMPHVAGLLMKGIGAAFSGIVGTAGTTAATAGATAATAGATAGATVATAGATAGATAATTAGSGLLGATGSGLGAIARGAGTVLKAAGNYVKVAHNAYKTVTQGITSFVGEMGKTALNKIPGVTIDSAASSFFGAESAWSNVQQSVMSNAGATIEAFNTAIGYTPAPAPVVTTTPTMGTSATASTNTAETFKVPNTAEGLTEQSLSLGKGGVQTTDVANAFDTAQASIAKNEQNFGKFFDDLNAPRVGGPAPVVEGVGTMKPNLLDDPKGYATNTYENFKENISEGLGNFRDDPVGTVFGEDPIGKGVDKASAQFTGTAVNRLVMGKPQPTRVYRTSIQGISPLASTIEYGSPEINARAYESQNNLFDFQAQNPWGSSAYDTHQATLNKFYQGGT